MKKPDPKTLNELRATIASLPNELKQILERRMAEPTPITMEELRSEVANLPEEVRKDASEAIGKVAVFFGGMASKEYILGVQRLRQAFAEFEKSALCLSDTKPLLDGYEAEVPRENVAKLVRKYVDLYEHGGDFDSIFNPRNLSLLFGEEMGVSRDDLLKIDGRQSKRAVVQALSSARVKTRKNQL